MSSKPRGGLAGGFAALRTGRMIILILATATVVLSLLSAAPLGPSLADAFGRTLAGDHVLLNQPSFAATDVFDFLREKAPAVAGVVAAGRWAALVILLQQILLTGGIVTVLGRAGSFPPADFIAGVRRNAWHNVKCFLLFLVFAVPALGLWIGATRAVGRKAFEGMPPGATPATVWRIATLAGALLLYAVFSLLHDFARASRRFDSDIGAWGAFGAARRALSGRWARALGLFLFWLVLGGLLLFVGILLEWVSPAVSALAIGLHMVLQVAVLTIRPAVRVGAWGSYLALYDAAVAASAPQAPLPPEPAPETPPLLSLEDQQLI